MVWRFPICGLFVVSEAVVSELWSLNRWSQKWSLHLCFPSQLFNYRWPSTLLVANQCCLNMWSQHLCTLMLRFAGAWFSLDGGFEDRLFGSVLEMSGVFPLLVLRTMCFHCALAVSHFSIRLEVFLCTASLLIVQSARLALHVLFNHMPSSVLCVSHSTILPRACTPSRNLIPSQCPVQNQQDHHRAGGRDHVCLVGGALGKSRGGSRKRTRRRSAEGGGGEWTS